MNGSQTNHFVGLDVGTSTVRCVVGMLDVNDGGKLSVIGHGAAPSLGMRRGSVVQVEEVADAITQAVHEAERISGVRIDRATVNINGAHISGIDSKGVIAISAGNHEISPEDRQRVDEAATAVKFPPNREIVQFFAKGYSLDGQRNIKEPVGMQGVRLEVEAHIITAATPNLRNLDAALVRASITPNNHTVSSLASAEATLTREQKEAGTLVLDIGAGTTNLIVVEDGEVQHVAVLPIGGSHITNDLAIGLKTDLDIAEAVKLQHATLLDTKKATATVSLHNRQHSFDMDEVQMICEARIEEIFEYVDKELQRIRKSRKLPGGVVLNGGTAKLPGIAEYAKKHLQLAARVGKVRGITGLADTVEDESFTSAVGLMMLDMLLPSHDMLSASPVEHNSIAIVKSLFKKIGL
ncbi:cell division protein FtsA [soil metagenome]